MYYFTQMFDRILQIINKCSSGTFDRNTVDEAVTLYFKKGSAAVETYLAEAKQLPAARRSELILSIEEENNRLNRLAVLINSIFFLMMLIIFILSIAFKFYINIVIFGSASLLWMLALARALSRLRRAKKNAYHPSPVPGNLS